MGITTLVKDIQEWITSDKKADPEVVRDFGVKLGDKLAERLSKGSDRPSLRLSNLGKPCQRQLWYSINKPEAGEPLPASARLKFLVGDIIEEVLIFLAKASGHKVEHEQKEVSLHGVKGHIDCVIDGELCDVKSASPFSFDKFKDGKLTQNDPFGYLTQLDGYVSALADDGVLDRADRGHFLVQDKTTGRLCLDTHERKDVDYEGLVQQRREMLSQPTPPERGYKDEKFGESGNRALGLECSYCPFNKECWPGVRTFMYYKGPKFLTVVKREPDVLELK